MSERRLTLTEHLREIRTRLVRSMIAVGVAMGISFLFIDHLFRLLLRPAPGIQLIYTELTEMMSVYIKVGLMAGVVLALPYLFLEVILFISPALRPKEKVFLYLFLPGALALFACGVAFGYFVLLPPALKILLNFGGGIATPYIRVENYLSVISRLLFWLGIIFEMPLATFILAKIGLVTSQGLARFRRWAVVLAFVLGAFITPTIDPVNQTLVAIPLIALYEMSIWLTKLARPAPRPKTAE